MTKKLLTFAGVLMLLTTNLPSSIAATPINCGKPIVSKGILQNPACKSGAPNLGVQSYLMTRYPAIMGLVSKPAPADAMQAICSDLNYTANHNPQNASGLVLAVMWQLSKYDLGTAWQAMWFPLVSQSTRDKFAAQYCLNGQYVAGPNSQQDDASALVAQNTILQNNCYSTRMANGDDPVNARNICVARYPNSLSWAMSTNHNAEQSCFQTRTANGDDPVNARNICLARYPIN